MDDQNGLGLDAPPQSKGGDAYRVLARKYRPQTFEALIGQEALVRTLSNAFATGRIAHSFMLTGVRGVGKTTTARIIARALNCIGPDGTNAKPTITPCGQCEACISIAESRHVDVMEMDAASRTGIDDIREIVEGVRYAPSSARYKVYIIDEVHMLSKQAFNGLLKTLEEPPPHVIFIFATTEIRKVPVTVLSRCQRFDLRRIGHGELTQHLARICDKENVAADAAALGLIARAAEGSARDALSLLDQAIARAGETQGRIAEATTRVMLGLADRSRTLDLFESVMRGDAATALAELRDQYDSGADPLVVMQDLSEITHGLTRAKFVPASASDPALSESESQRIAAMAEKLPVSALTRAWQLLLKGIVEVREAAQPIDAAEMLLIRIAFAADLPPPEKLVREAMAEAPAPPPSVPVSTPSAPPPRGPAPRGGAPRADALNAVRSEPEAAAPPRALARFEDVVALAGEEREIRLKMHLERDTHLVRFEPGRIDIRLEPNAPRTFASDLGQKLTQWTGMRWIVSLVNEEGEPTLQQKSEARRHAAHASVMEEPLVKAAFKAFPQARILAVRDAVMENATADESDGESVEENEE